MRRCRNDDRGGAIHVDQTSTWRGAKGRAPSAIAPPFGKAVDYLNLNRAKCSLCSLSLTMSIRQVPLHDLSVFQT